MSGTQSHGANGSNGNKRNGSPKPFKPVEEKHRTDSGAFKALVPTGPSGTFRRLPLVERALEDDRVEFGENDGCSSDVWPVRRR